jgi:hypothetical protein
MRIGIDIGRVIIKGDTDKPNQFFTKNYLTAPAVDLAFESITKIVERYGSDYVFLVSKCGESTEEKTLEWLEYQQFYIKTGIDQSQVLFCRKRYEKKLICADYNIKLFIDDRYTVLEHLTDLKRLYLFNPVDSELEKFNQTKNKKHIYLVSNWTELMGHFF